MDFTVPSPNPSSRVLIVDDEKNIRATLQLCLENFGCEVTSVGHADEALAALQRAPYDVAFLDLRLDKDSGLDLLPRMLTVRPALAVVIITAYAAVETAVEALKRGALDYLPKPFTPAQIRHLVDQLAARRAATNRICDLQDQLASAVPEVDLDSHAPSMRDALSTVQRAAASDASILLMGESGTGKSVMARALHLQSPRRTRPFITVNCPTLSEELLASELFGHARGAFTGAVRDQAGRVEAAEGGTLFLDEIGELSPSLQAKLLRFLQERVFERLGESRTRRADVRIVAATNRDLKQDVRQGRFREDLLYRLNVICVTVPPLRERLEDIAPLARRFLAFFARTAGRHAPVLTDAAEAVLRAYAWPGNLRELRNVMERTVILWPSDTLSPEALPREMRADTRHLPTLGGDFSLEDIEREHIVQVLNRIPGQEDAARLLGVDASTLWRKRKKAGFHNG